MTHFFPAYFVFKEVLKYIPHVSLSLFSLLSQALVMSTDMGMDRICLRTMFYNTKFTLLDRPNDPDPNSSLGSDCQKPLSSLTQS